MTTEQQFQAMMGLMNQLSGNVVNLTTQVATLAQVAAQPPIPAPAPPPAPAPQVKTQRPEAYNGKKELAKAFLRNATLYTEPLVTTPHL